MSDEQTKDDALELAQTQSVDRRSVALVQRGLADAAALTDAALDSSEIYFLRLNSYS
jgi:hypothetical protein